jgi:hypothetical protein
VRRRRLTAKVQISMLHRGEEFKLLQLQLQPRPGEPETRL